MTTHPLLFQCTHGGEDPERATLPFVAANVAAHTGQRAIVVCTAEGVRLGTRGGADGITAAGLPPLDGLIAEFIANGGALWLSGASTRARGITEGEVIAGASIVGAARVVEAVVSGARSVVFA